MDLRYDESGSSNIGEEFVEEITPRRMNVNISYPNNPYYFINTELEVIDLDKECEDDIASGDGFLISAPKATIKKDINNPDGIYSPKFGPKFGDKNPFGDRYSCECGFYTGRINHGLECPVCHKTCKFIDDRMDIFGWIRVNEPYHIIHPHFYDALNYIFGSSPYNKDGKRMKGTKLENMLNYNPKVDINGFIGECEFKPDKEPFFGIGMIDFYERFDEILDYYIKLNPKKMDYYNEIQKYRNIVFCHSIPVYTTHLRPSSITDGCMRYEPNNACYNMINRHVHKINKTTRNMNRDKTTKNIDLFSTQSLYMKLCNNIIKNMSGKKGNIRMLFGGRFNFAVIRQNAQLRCDQVLLPYVMLVKCLQQRIINILIRTYNISPSEAYDMWSRALANKDPRICEIIDTIIRNDPSGEGLPVIINRNPTISFGRELQMYCIGYTNTLTMSIPLQVLKMLAADFDGENDFYADTSIIVVNSVYAEMYIFHHVLLLGKKK